MTGWGSTWFAWTSKNVGLYWRTTGELQKSRHHLILDGMQWS
jgi:hypothetical protein